MSSTSSPHSAGGRKRLSDFDDPWELPPGFYPRVHRDISRKKLKTTDHLLSIHAQTPTFTEKWLDQAIRPAYDVATSRTAHLFASINSSFAEEEDLPNSDSVASTVQDCVKTPDTESTYGCPTDPDMVGASQCHGDFQDYLEWMTKVLTLDMNGQSRGDEISSLVIHEWTDNLDTELQQ